MKYEKMDFPAVITIIGGTDMVFSFLIAQIGERVKFYFFFTGLGLGFAGVVCLRENEETEIAKRKIIALVSIFYCMI
ncbi:MAG: hypothetical protein R3C26_23775 [Calditrichia bacterium]